MQFLKFLYKNGNLKNFLNTKSDQNIHQNAPNCTILKNFLGGACPRTPLAQAKIELNKVTIIINYPHICYNIKFTKICQNIHQNSPNCAIFSLMKYLPPQTSSKRTLTLSLCLYKK